MSKPLVWLACFAAGLFVGFFVGRAWDKPETPASQVEAADESKVPVAVVPSSPTPVQQEVARAFPQQGTAPGPVAAPPRPEDDAGAMTPPSVPLQSGKSPFAPYVDSGVVNSVDAGDLFNRQIARPSTSDQPNQLGDAHRALEREPRDDGWAYTMEAELQNAMLSQTSTGAFKMEHVECRTTICEVRVSGNGDQADSVRDWGNTLQGNPFDQRLFVNVASTVASHDRVDAIYIFRRPVNR